ncbi:MAG: redox-regulated ATPase YchF [Candidatus Aenigmarchaeota archaeon]|nr:redox-regulated ATPase YchF [Candidatus Aenigmarchaeota archaeon]
MIIGLCGKSNTGKTTMFSAMTLIDAEISNRIFTTIRPNIGIAYTRAECPCKSLGIKCKPKNSKCVDGTRLVPIKIVDVAGLVPDAHKGRGLGNQFLSDIMEASAIIHVVDISGSTDNDGNPVPRGSHDPVADVDFFKKEIDYWILGILMKNWGTILRKSPNEKFEELVYKQLSGLGVSRENVVQAINKSHISSLSGENELLAFIETLRKEGKPIIIAANKIDIAGADEIYKKISSATREECVPCSAEAELALRRAAEKGLISYMPGASDFQIVGEMDEKHKSALNFIKENVLAKYGSTGVQKLLDTAVFDMLKMIVVYPVENEHKFSDKKGTVLPDALLLRKGSTALDLAYKVHEDIGKKFIAAVDAKTGRHIAADYVLKNGDIISIKAGK